MTKSANIKPLAYRTHPPEDGQDVNGLGVASMVLGVISTLLACVWFLGTPCATLAITFGVIARSQNRRSGLTTGGIATTGIVCGIFSLLMCLGVSLWMQTVKSQPMVMMPKAYQSKTRWSMPQNPPELDKSMDVTGVYSKTNQFEGLRVDRLDADSNLYRGYGLREGDVIIQNGGTSFDGDEPVEVAKAWTLSLTLSNLSITILRGEVKIYLRG